MQAVEVPPEESHESVPYYHVRLDLTGWMQTESVLDLSEAQLYARFLRPREEGRPIVCNGRVVQLSDIRRVTIHRTDQPSSVFGPQARARLAQDPPAVPVPEEYWLAGEGEDVTDQVITSPPGSDLMVGGNPRRSAQGTDPRKVFVVHGRNEAIRSDLFAFLRSVDLHPIEWEQAVHATGEAAPYVGQVLDAAFEEAQAVVVVLTPDDEARLLPPFQRPGDPVHELTLTPQPRANVLFEAGMAFGRRPDKTILVAVGRSRPFSDIAGRHTIEMDGSAGKRRALVQRLRSAGCVVGRYGDRVVDHRVVHNPYGPAFRRSSRQRKRSGFR